MDKTPPELLEVLPPDDATLQKGLKRVEFRFSENIDPRSVGNNVRIFPTPPNPPDISVKKNRVIVKLTSDLADNTTYIISLGRSVADLRKNKVKQEIVSAFSTGKVIDKGKIAGRVYGTKDPKLEYEILLYKLKGSFSDSVVWMEPDYRTYADESGFFRFGNLPTGVFRLIGFAHPVGQNKYRSGKATFALPFRDPVAVNSLSEEAAEVSLLFHEFNPDPPAIGNVFFNDEGYLEFAVNKSLEQEQINQLSIQCNSCEITHIWMDKEPENSFLARILRENTDSSFTLTISGLRDTLGIPSEKDTFLFEIPWKEIVDTLPPGIRIERPGRKNKIFPDSVVVLRFNEPVTADSLYSAITIFRRDSIPVDFSLSMENDLRIVLKLNSVMNWGESYTVRILGKGFRDFSGNICGDSLQVYKITTISDDELGSISGKVYFRSVQKGRFLVRSQHGNQSPEAGSQAEMDSQGNFMIEKIKAGKYYLMVFQDINENSKYDPGKLIPFTPAEPFYFSEREVNVRARWETTDVRVDYNPGSSDED